MKIFGLLLNGLAGADPAWERSALSGEAFRSTSAATPDRRGDQAPDQNNCGITSGDLPNLGSEGMLATASQRRPPWSGRR